VGSEMCIRDRPEGGCHENESQGVMVVREGFSGCSDAVWDALLSFTGPGRVDKPLIIWGRMLKYD